MSNLTSIGKTLLKPMRVSQMDLKVARTRLREFGVSHAELSAVLAPHGCGGEPNDRLIDLLLALTARARKVDLSALAERNAPALVNLWPGEHYRLLAALVQEIEPKNIVEIGTFTGLSSLAMLAYMSPGAQLTTFDIIPWSQIPGTFLRQEDFDSGRLRQAVCDLKNIDDCASYKSLLQSADMIFIDGPKDGIFEGVLLDNFASIGLRQHTLLVFDDIRVWNMLRTWLQIRCPKLDITSVGHYSGTGLVDWLPLNANPSR